MTNHEGQPSPYPSLAGRELDVPAGEYRLISGSDAPIWFDPAHLERLTEHDYPTMPGRHLRGFYMLDNRTSCSVFSFLYHKLDQNGDLEETERAIVSTGVGYGEHFGHPGQPPTWYEVGAQIGTIDPRFGDFVTIEEPSLIRPKSFSLACIVGNPLGEPILANPPEQP